MRLHPFGFFALLSVSACSSSAAPSVTPTGVGVAVLPVSDLGALSEAIGDRRVVLLGENGHGVGEFTTLKSDLVRWLHEEKGFDILAVESGFFECSTVDAAIIELGAWEGIRKCMSYAFEHAELIALFEYIQARRATEHPLFLSGIDFQVQGNDSRGRPAALRGDLLRSAADLADRVAALDSVLLHTMTLGNDPVAAWARAEGDAARALYDSAARRSEGSTRWTLEGANAFVGRLQARAAADPATGVAPRRFYGSRDEWMARTVAWLADSGAAPRKVIVWLHNDHGRYGAWDTPAGPVASAGALLRKWYPDDVYSIGFLMGGGEVADNSRRVREMVALPPDAIERNFAGVAQGYLLLFGRRGARDQGVGGEAHPYLRNGWMVDSMVPGAEFDALMYVDRAAPPHYQLP